MLMDGVAGWLRLALAVKGFLLANSLVSIQITYHSCYGSSRTKVSFYKVLKKQIDLLRSVPFRGSRQLSRRALTMAFFLLRFPFLPAKQIGKALFRVSQRSAIREGKGVRP